MPAALLPGSFADWELRWFLESFVGWSGVTIGIPGLAAIGIFANPMFEAIPRIRREGTVGRLPLLPYSAMAAQGGIWTVYGFIVGNPAIWTPNLFALTMGLYYWRVYLRHCPQGADWLPFTGAHHAAVFLGTMAFCGAVALCLPAARSATVLGFAGNVFTMTMFGGPLAAIKTVLREKSTRSMPFGFTCAVNLNCNLWFFYAYFVIDDPFIYLQDGVGLLLTTVQLALFLRFGIQR